MSRGIEFRNKIREVLRRGNFKQKYVDLITDEQGMKLFSKAFTHQSADPDNNYEFLETLGDQTANKSIVWYLARRFPQINCADGKAILSRLKIVYVSKSKFSEFSSKLGFWNFVVADEETKANKKKPTLEDVFESFLGATETLIDDRIKMGAGYLICYNIIKSIFDEIDISLRYEDLYDAKTRLKETFDFFKNNGIGDFEYLSERNEQLVTAVVERIVNGVVDKKMKQVVGGTRSLLGRGTAALKQDAEQVAAAQALKRLKELGFYKPVPEKYLTFCK